MIIQLIFIQIITLIIIVLILKSLFHRQLNVALTRLKYLQEKNIEKEEELREQIEQFRVQKDKELSDVKAEAEQILQEAKYKSKRIYDDNDSKAQEHVANIMSEAQVKLNFKEKELQKDQNEQAILLAVKLFQLSFTLKGKQSLQHQLIEEFIDEIRVMSQDRFTISPEKACVRVVFSLREDERESLVQILSEKMGKTIQIEEIIDEGLIAGLIVRLDSLTLDGSLRNKIQKIIPQLK